MISEAIAVGTGYVIFNNDGEFQKLGLKNVPGTHFQRRNLLVGKNGSGKTRFLNALYSEFKSRPPSDAAAVVRLDFSNFHLSGGKASGKPADKGLFDILILEEEASFFDFLELAEQENLKFIHDITKSKILYTEGLRRRLDRGLGRMNDHLREFIGYEIYFGDEPEHEPIIRKVDEGGKSARERPYRDMLAEFSPGERFIFYLCIFMYYVETVRGKGVILLLDEPELHLHPRVLTEVMRWLYESTAVKQLWVATHSLFLMPLFCFEEICLFEDGTIMPRDSKMYRRAYGDLVGLGDDGMFELLKSIDSWEYYRFIVECFCPPTTVGRANPRDEQFVNFVRSINAGRSGGIRVLDYGAGEWRIWECLQLAHSLGELDAGKIRYEAYEPYPREETLRRLEMAYGENPFQMYSRIDDVPDHSYDVVVLMNVLHEIDILDWEQTFRDIRRVLTPEGVLIFLEVKTLSLGEQPYGNTGYLVLGSEEVRRLFRPDSPGTGDGSSESRKTNCWAIKAFLLDRVDRASVRECVNSLIDSSKTVLTQAFNEKMAAAHGGAGSPGTGLTARKYAFWSQQYINAVLALERLENRGQLTVIAGGGQEPSKINFQGFSTP